MKKEFVLAVAIALSTMAANGQQEAATRYSKIERLFDLMNMDSSYIQAAKVSAGQTIANTPQLGNRKEETLAFFIKYMSYPAIKKELMTLYDHYYTPAEIDTLIEFYNTAAGKKQQTVSAQIQMEINQRLTANLQAHAEELNQLISTDTNKNSDTDKDQ